MRLFMEAATRSQFIGFGQLSINEQKGVLFYEF
jgi:hypothetical protein